MKFLKIRKVEISPFKMIENTKSFSSFKQERRKGHLCLCKPLKRWVYSPFKKFFHWFNSPMICDSYKYFFFSVFLKKFLLLFNYSCMPFLPIPPPHPSQSQPLSPTSTLPLDLVHVSFKVVPVIPSPHCPLPTPLWRLLDCRTETFNFNDDQFIILKNRLCF